MGIRDGLQAGTRRVRSRNGTRLCRASRSRRRRRGGDHDGNLLVQDNRDSVQTANRRRNSAESPPSPAAGSSRHLILARPMAALDFWYEFGSTYSYPAAMRIERLVDAAHVELRWRPFLLG